MDKNRLKKIIESALEFSYAELQIIDFNMLETHKMNDKGIWEKFSYSIFMTLKKKQDLSENNSPTINTSEITRMLETLTGFEFSLELVLD